MNADNIVQDKRLKKVELNIKFSNPIVYEIKLKGFDAIIELYSTEHTFWSEVRSQVFKTSFLEALTQIKRILGEFKDALPADEKSFNEAWSRVNSEIQRISTAKNLLPSFWSISQFCKDLTDNAAHGVLAYLSYAKEGSTSREPSWRTDALYSFLVAHEFSRRNGIVSNFEEAEQESITRTISETKTRFNDTQTVLNDHLSEVANLHNEMKEGYKKLISETIPEHESAIKKSVNSFDEEKIKWFESAEKKLSGLEERYGDHMRLKKPVEFWGNRAKALNKSKWTWFIVLAASTLVMIGILLFLLIDPPDVFKIKFSFMEPLAMKGLILFITLVSFMAFFIKIAAKLLVSAVHLREDAKERQDLTHVYLALIADSAVNEEVKTIVYQSLFGRADTGLLKGEGGPTLPVGDVIKNLNSK